MINLLHILGLGEALAQNKPDQIIAIGDVHGCADELKQLLRKLPLTRGTTLVFLGDYIDRGIQSREVVDLVLEVKKHMPVVTLMGNHEAMLLDFLEAPKSPKAAMYIYNGGGTTLASYGDAQGCYAIPSEHLAFFNDLKLSYSHDNDFFFVHAGVPNIPLEELNDEEHRDSFLWVRKTFLDSQYQWSKKVVHGHTPVANIDNKPNRLNLDTGCVYANKLSAVVFPRMRVYQVQKLSKVEPLYLRDQSSTRRAIRFEGAVPVVVCQGSVRLEMETLNYSELGILVRDVGGNESNLILQTAQFVNGVIGEDPERQVTFKGIIRRRAVNADGACYAIEFLKPVEEQSG